MQRPAYRDNASERKTGNAGRRADSRSAWLRRAKAAGSSTRQLPAGRRGPHVERGSVGLQSRKDGRRRAGASCAGLDVLVNDTECFTTSLSHARQAADDPVGEKGKRCIYHGSLQAPRRRRARSGMRVAGKYAADRKEHVCCRPLSKQVTRTSAPGAPPQERRVRSILRTALATQRRPASPARVPRGGSWGSSLEGAEQRWYGGEEATAVARPPLPAPAVRRPSGAC